MRNPYRTSTSLAPDTSPALPDAVDYSYTHPEAFGRAARELVEEAFEAALSPTMSSDPYESRPPDFEQLVRREGGYLVACGYAVAESREPDLREAYLQARRRAAWRAMCEG